ncbi:MAG: hypothetical protein KAT71_01190, partial [Gammaproteobacteria bacterium]|nr:hypothetical protein [Gammaproteobacteria bacterium]
LFYSPGTAEKAIYTIMIGDDPMYDYTYKAFQRYADKIGADLIRCTEPRYAASMKQHTRKCTQHNSLL